MDVRSLRRDWRFTVGVISGGHFISHFYILAFPPLFPAWQAQFGFTNAELGLIMSASLVASLLQTPVGVLVDRVGAKYVFVTGVAIASLGIALVSLGTSFLTIMAFTLFSGIGQSAFHPADYAMIDAAATEENKGKGFSLHSFGGYAGFAAAPVVVGGLSALAGWRTALLAVGGVGLAYAAFAFVGLVAQYREETPEEPSAAGPSTDESTDATPSLRASLAAFLSPTIVVLFSFFLVFTAGLKGIQTFTPVLLVDVYQYAESIGNTALTLFFASAAGGILAGGYLSDRYDPRALLVVALGAGAGVVWLGTMVAYGVGPGVALAVFVVAGAFVGVIYPCRDRLVSQYSVDGAAGKSFGFVFTGTTVGGLVSPPALGYVIDVSSPTVAFVLVGIAFAMAATIVVAISWDGRGVRASVGTRSD